MGPPGMCTAAHCAVHKPRLLERGAELTRGRLPWIVSRGTDSRSDGKTAPVNGGAPPEGPHHIAPHEEIHIGNCKGGSSSNKGINVVDRSPPLQAQGGLRRFGQQIR